MNAQQGVFFFQFFGNLKHSSNYHLFCSAAQIINKTLPIPRRPRTIRICWSDGDAVPAPSEDQRLPSFLPRLHHRLAWTSSRLCLAWGNLKVSPWEFTHLTMHWAIKLGWTTLEAERGTKRRARGKGNRKASVSGFIQVRGEKRMPTRHGLLSGRNSNAFCWTASRKLSWFKTQECSHF